MYADRPMSFGVMGPVDRWMIFNGGGGDFRTGRDNFWLGESDNAL